MTSWFLSFSLKNDKKGTKEKAIIAITEYTVYLSVCFGLVFSAYLIRKAIPSPK